MKVISTKEELNEARLQQRAFIFLWVNWSIHARESEIDVRRLLQVWNRDFPECEAVAYRVDLSDQEGELWDTVADWLRNGDIPRGDLVWAGAGALLWLRSGAIINSVKYAAHIGYDKLLVMTREHFKDET